jgi:hypothetical protein
MTYEIWSEGFRATGESGEARLEGIIEADTFLEACDKLAAIKEWDKRPGYYNRDHLTVWGCRLFTSEGEARRSFG